MRCLRLVLAFCERFAALRGVWRCCEACCGGAAAGVRVLVSRILYDSGGGRTGEDLNECASFLLALALPFESASTECRPFGWPHAHCPNGAFGSMSSR
mmetsp:Transcript_20459/g.44476  ORF Transcript_20459/g.44476 Transcript_20459/m.44476 type:complete len:98 (+) Transcript_20459:252-545(+)